MNATQPTAPKIIKQGKATEIVLCQDGAYVVRDFSGIGGAAVHQADGMLVAEFHGCREVAEAHARRFIEVMTVA